MKGIEPNPAGRAARAGPLLALALVAAFPVEAPRAGQIDSATYFSLRRGMSESEVLVRAGPPDLVTTPGDEVVTVERERVRTRADGSHSLARAQRSQVSVIERWHYVPDEREPDPWITIVSMKRGEVWEIERTKVFSRHRAAPAAGDDAGEPREPARSDDQIRADRADRTLQAAERYAETRARLKQEAEDADASSRDAVRVYRTRDGDGSVYYGDRPPGPRVQIVDLPAAAPDEAAPTR